MDMVNTLHGGDAVARALNPVWCIVDCDGVNKFGDENDMFNKDYNPDHCNLHESILVQEIL